jgi:cytochrome c-type biogenesis protein
MSSSRPGDGVDFYQLILVPIAFGLVGFIEPCSIGANIIFLGYLNSRGGEKMCEALKFTVTRATFLGTVGFAVGVLGQPLRMGAYSYSLLLGILYMAIGLLGLVWAHRGGGFPSIDFGRYFPKEGAVPLGVVFGLSAPACSLPLFIALIGLGALKGAWVGFLTLFLFGLALSAPLVWMARSHKADELLRKLGRLAAGVPYLSESLLLVVGAITALIAWRQLAAT